jgi:GAF domain-containing protein
VIANANEPRRSTLEQAALRRVATLVARGAPPRELFAAVAEEVGRVVDAPGVVVARYEDQDAVTVCGTFPSHPTRFPVGTRVPLDTKSVPALVRERARPARLDDYSELEGEVGEAARSSGNRSSVGVPITVAGRVWGVVIASGTEQLPEDTEVRLAEFTELLAAAIADTHGREALTQVAGEQSALRHVATLVARGSEPHELFAVVAEEVGRVVDAQYVAVARYESDETATVCGTFPLDGPIYRMGERVSLEGVSVLARIREHGEPARIDDYTDLEGEVAHAVRAGGVQSGVGVPIVVAGRIWGSIVAWSPERLPEDFEARLAEFTELLAAAISNAEATEAVAQLADEQAALRRVATLVAQGAPPADVFEAVSVEVDRLIGLAPHRNDVAGVVRFDPGPEHVVAGVSRTLDAIPLGSRWPPTDLYAPTRVLRTGRSARVGENDLDAADGPAASFLRDHGYLSQVASPIVVDGRLWGAISANSAEELPPDTEERLEKFIELVATAVANAESQKELRALADEQTALRRVATLVAEGASTTTLAAAVLEEVVAVLGAPGAWLIRYEPERTMSVLAAINDPAFPIGSRWPLEGTSVSAAVFETGRSARIDDFAGLEGAIAARSRESGFLSSLGVPIVVDGTVWGAICLGTTDGEPLPPGTEDRLERFTALVATAISNADSRERAARLTDEQAALRRVATLVAESVPTTSLFTSVANEVASVLGAPTVIIGRYGPGPFCTVVSEAKNPAFPVGSEWPLDGPSVARTIFDEARAARIDDYSSLPGTIAAGLRSAGIRSTVGAPIVVGGSVWGCISVLAADPHLLPADSEKRLEEFTRLVAAAISKAEADDGLAKLLDQQAALRRVATLVAEGAEPETLFTAVAVEVGQLFDFAAVTLNRYEENAVVVIADPLDSGFPVGSRWPFDGDSLAVRVHATRRMARIDDYSDIESSAAARMRERASRSAIGVPIFVEGDLWGLLCVGAAANQLLPADTADRIAGFVDLVGTAVANGQARDRLRLLADEQAALRRVATLAAEGAPPTELFAAVAVEVARLFDFAGVTLNRYEENAVVVVADPLASGFPVGSRWPFDGDSLAVRVHATRQMARIDDYSDIESSAAARIREGPYRSAIGVPIFVEGALWGVLCVGAAAADLLPADTADRIVGFVDLVGTAIANGQARDGLRLLAEEQAALRRVATLVARDAPPSEVFAAVAMEVGKLLDTDITVVGRYDGDGAATAIGSWSASPGGVPVGTRSVLGGRNVLTLVAETARPARLDGYDGASGEAAEIARRHGWSSSIAAPIIVEGRLWGVMLVATQAPEAFPAGAEDRLAAFTDLVATALANAQAHDAVRQFGEEQAALGRVATLVAAGAAPERVFGALVEETATLLDLKRIELLRYGRDNTVTLIATSSEQPFPVGSTWSLDDQSVLSMIARTARAARIDDYGVLEGELARLARSAGFRSAIGAPVTVEGEVWGAVIASSTEPEPIPEWSEVRLGRFTELVATAVANAESRGALATLADEQAALRRVATLVAAGTRPEWLFAAVADEVQELLGADSSAIVRFEDDTTVVTVGTHAAVHATDQRDGSYPDFVVASVLETRRAARFDTDDPATADMPAEMRRAGIRSVVANPIVVEGELWGVIVVSSRRSLPPTTEARLASFTALVATAIANAASATELAASRRRIVAAADEARRRIERDLHDGIQQRLIALNFRARAMTRRPPSELPAIAAELSEDLRDVTDELREVSRGIHPTILTEAGLGPALRALARRSDIPIEVDVRLDKRLSAPIEAAAYYIASEALTNVAKHAQANVVELIAAEDDGLLGLEVRDDGIGGADAEHGSGIIGLTDRVGALGGTISITSPPGGGTTLSVRLPVTT